MMTMISTIDEMARYFNKTRNAVIYQIKLGRLPDPRSTPIQSEAVALWPRGDKRGRKPGPSAAKQRFIVALNALVVRVADLESRVTFQETLSHTHD
jgi:hypothetical protein